MDIVARLRQGVDNQDDFALMQSAADVIEFLRTEVDRLVDDRNTTMTKLRTEADQLRLEVDCLGESLDKCHAKLMGTDGPVHGPELERSLLVGGRYRAPECGGFQGFED